MNKESIQADYVFVGNRIFVIEEMVRLKLKLKKVFVIKGSDLERQLPAKGVAFTTVETKEQLLGELNHIQFDILISNGCPFILPVKPFSERASLLVNIHPSYLPDLRGRDPVPGALLWERDSGATCHVMDEGVDTGNIIAQVKIPYTDELDAGLLYQLSFLAEKECFLKAFEKNFLADIRQSAQRRDVYYSRRPEDQIIDFQADDEHKITCKVRAFGNRSQGVRFVFKGETFKVYETQISRNPYLMGKLDQYKDTEVVFNYEDVLVIRKGDGFLKLQKITGPLEIIKPRDILGLTEIP